MTVPHDEQPLTRRQLRELERQKPRKLQDDEAAAPAAVVAPTVVAESSTAHVTSPTDAATPVTAETATGAPPVSTSSEVPGTEVSAPNSSLPILSRRARRALSADHPLAGSTAAEASGAVTGDVDRGQAAIESGAGAPMTGPIIAELITDQTSPVAVSQHDDARDADAQQHYSGQQNDVRASDEPIIAELMVVDEAAPLVETRSEDEEFAEIDDSHVPETVHIITVDDAPHGPILAPLFQPAAERDVVKADPTDSSFDDLIASRGVGASNSVASTSALVLPSVPNHGDVGTALDETGEVIITGSIDLPMSLGSTGAAPADGLESSELDAYLDPDGDVGSDVAPVSATRAISTHGSNAVLVTPPKRGRANAPVVLASTAAALLVVVVGLLVAAFVFRVF